MNTIACAVPAPIAVEGSTKMEAQKMYDLATERIQRAARRRIDRARRRQTGKVWSFCVGDRVLLRHKTLSSKIKRENHRLQLYYIGPYKITKIFSTDTVQLSDIEKNKIIGTYHKDMLKPFHEEQNIEATSSTRTRDRSVNSDSSG